MTKPKRYVDRRGVVSKIVRSPTPVSEISENFSNLNNKILYLFKFKWIKTKIISYNQVKINKIKFSVNFRVGIRMNSKISNYDYN